MSNDHRAEPGHRVIASRVIPTADGIVDDDAEHMHQTLFDAGNLSQPYHSINTDVHKRIRSLEADGARDVLH